MNDSRYLPEFKSDKESEKLPGFDDRMKTPFIFRSGFDDRMKTRDEMHLTYALG